MAGGIEFGQYASLVTGELARYGYRPAAPDAKPDMIVRFDYGVDKGRERIRREPGFYDPFYDIESNSSTGEHRGIIDALREHDGDRASELMRQHIRVSQGSLDKPEDFEPRA